MTIEKVHKRTQTFSENSFTMDFSVRKRSNSVEDKDPVEGKAFLLPKSCIQKRANKYFFIIKEPLTHQSLLAQISNLSTSQVFRVAVILNLRPPNIDTLKFFIQRIAQTDEMMLDKVQKAVSIATNRNMPNAHPPVISSSTDYPIFDIRYKPFENSPIILDKPIDMGAAHVNFSFQIPILPQDVHIILQSYLVGVTPPMIKWPQTLSIYVNKILVQPQGVFNFLVIDLHQFRPGSIVEISSFPEQSQYKFVIRCARYFTFDNIIQAIKSIPRPEYFNEQELSLICPLTGQPMKYPGKGNQCQHTQAFNLKAYLKRGVSKGKWFCPVCGKFLPHESLIYSFKSEEALNYIKMASQNRMQMVQQVMQQPPPQFPPQPVQQPPPQEQQQQQTQQQPQQQSPEQSPQSQPTDQSGFQSENEFGDSLFDDVDRDLFDFF